MKVHLASKQKIKDIISVIQTFLFSCKANVVYIFKQVAFEFPHIYL